MNKDYKKLYEEALLRARDLHDNHPLGQPQTWSICEKIFPELNESEDERIRKEIISFITDRKNWFPKEETKSSWISWLEKQGEQNPADKEEELTEFEKEVDAIIDENIKRNIGLKYEAWNLLNLARKEIEKENSEFKPKFTYNENDYSKLANKLIEFRNNTPLCSVSYREGEGRKIILHYEKEITDLARKEIFKDLPKWKKSKKNEELDCHVAIQQDDRVVLSDFVQKDEYYITLDVLKKLPKEE